jgi:alkyl hydroperoxide reductase subunit AhpF
MRTFTLHRTADPSGVSGTGLVAEGVEWTDGTVALRWCGGTPSTVVHADIEAVKKIQGHDGATVVRFG